MKISNFRLDYTALAHSKGKFSAEFHFNPEEVTDQDSKMMEQAMRHLPGVVTSLRNLVEYREAQGDEAPVVVIGREQLQKLGFKNVPRIRAKLEQLLAALDQYVLATDFDGDGQEAAVRLVTALDAAKREIQS